MHKKGGKYTDHTHFADFRRETQFAAAVITPTAVRACTWPEENQTCYILFVESRRARSSRRREARHVCVTLDPWRLRAFEDRTKVELDFLSTRRATSTIIGVSRVRKPRDAREDIPEIRRMHGATLLARRFEKRSELQRIRTFSRNART